MKNVVLLDDEEDSNSMRYSGTGYPEPRLPGSHSNRFSLNGLEGNWGEGSRSSSGRM